MTRRADRRRRAALHRLADELGVAVRFRDGLGTTVDVGDETLLRVCAALGAELDSLADAPSALRAHRDAPGRRSPVRIAWDGRLASIGADPTDALPFGVHRLVVDAADDGPSTVISAPTTAWRPADAGARRWGVAAQLGALRSGRSRSMGDLADFATLARAVGAAGGSVASVLPILPTFNDPPAEPSPYSPVSRLFWSELMLDVGAGDGAPVDRLDVEAAAAEVRRALAGTVVDASAVDGDLAAYARFRGAQRRLGRDWRTWPAAARDGDVTDDQVDADEERFHLAAQLTAREQLADLRRELDASGVVLGLDLAVGVHPEGYDGWSRPQLFASTMAVGAPPDAGFPSGQNWGFHPVLPAVSAAEGHDYLRAAIAHQAAVAGLLRIDHVMALRRLYWIPEGMPLDQGTYVSYPMEELFALLCLESHLHGCEIVGENLGTVPPEIDAALARHGIRGMALAQFSADGRRAVAAMGADEVAFVGTHDTPTFAGWVAGDDIDLRVGSGLLAADAAPAAHRGRTEAVRHLVAEVGGDPDDPDDLLERLIVALGASSSPLVVLWLEDLWLEPEQVNVPGTSSLEHPNWQRPMTRTLDDALADPGVARLLAAIDAARRGPESTDVAASG